MSLFRVVMHSIQFNFNSSSILSLDERTEDPVWDCYYCFYSANEHDYTLQEAKMSSYNTIQYSSGDEEAKRG